MNINRIDFKTPKGLKIRLDYRYLFYRLLTPDRYYTDTEITENITMQNAISKVECFFLLPTALIQIFTTIALLTNISIPTYCITMLGLFLFGSLWRSITQDFLISTAMLFLSTLYNALWWLVYIALIVLVIVDDKSDMILPYLLTRISLFVVSTILNHITVTVTMKKYGIPFNDTEICAFMVFHHLSGSNQPISNFIVDYVSAVQQNRDNEENTSQTEETKTESTHHFKAAKEIKDANNLNQTAERITVHTLSTINGYYKDVIERTEENTALIDKWLNMSTGCLYMTIMYRDGEAVSMFVTKEFFDTLYKNFEI